MEKLCVIKRPIKEKDESNSSFTVTIMDEFGTHYTMNTNDVKQLCGLITTWCQNVDQTPFVDILIMNNG